MIPIDEILLFDSTKKIPEISNLIDPLNYIDVTVPIHGLQVNERVFVEDSKRDQVTAKVKNIGYFCSGNESIPVILRTPKFIGVVVGRLIELLLRENKINLTDFRKLKSDWTDRAAERVQPKSSNYFDIFLQERHYRANLNDVAPNGISIYVAISEPTELDDVINEEIVMPLKIHPYFERCMIKAKVKNIRLVAKNLARLGLQFIPDRKNTLVLQNYVNHRKEEILKEIQYNFLKLQSVPETKDLYF
jgi:predicted transport protein